MLDHFITQSMAYLHGNKVSFGKSFPWRGDTPLGNGFAGAIH
jgi:hypothetical protein